MPRGPGRGAPGQAPRLPEDASQSASNVASFSSGPSEADAPSPLGYAPWASRGHSSAGPPLAHQPPLSPYRSFQNLLPKSFLQGACQGSASEEPRLGGIDPDCSGPRCCPHRTSGEGHPSGRGTPMRSPRGLGRQPRSGVQIPASGTEGTKHTPAFYKTRCLCPLTLAPEEPRPEAPSGFPAKPGLGGVLQGLALGAGWVKEDPLKGKRRLAPGAGGRGRRVTSDSSRIHSPPDTHPRSWDGDAPTCRLQPQSLEEWPLNLRPCLACPG